MSNAYLDIAEIVLRRRRTPLSPRAILADAYVNGAVPSHLYGRTQEKTLQARLSEDISRLREESLFYRTNRARFFLREFIYNTEIPIALKTEYFARPRRKDLKNERILVFDETPKSANANPNFRSKAELDSIFLEQKFRYTTWSEMRSNENTEVPVYSFVIFHNKSEVLTHSVGQFNDEAHPSKGYRSLGFGSVVRALDSDLLYDAYHGIIGSGIKELVYSLGLPRDLARAARYEGHVNLHCAMEGIDANFGKYVRAVMTYQCPDNFLVSKASLALNRLLWLPLTACHPGSDFDTTSNELIETGIFRRIMTGSLY